jgi:hypothetical protein
LLTDDELRIITTTMNRVADSTRLGRAEEQQRSQAG